MAISNPFSITYGGRQVGGSTSYQLHGPYVIEKTYDSMRLAFDVIIVAGGYSTLKSLSDALEADFRKRLTDGQTLLISLSGSTWTYTMGTTMLNARASVTKTGNPDTDKGYSRAYTCVVEAELPADEDDGLRDVEVAVNYEPGRQKVVTMRGTYTATATKNAAKQYEDDFDAEAAVYLTAIDSTATFELVDESYTYDREHAGDGTPKPHLCLFTRQYIELLENQSSAGLDSENIRDHRVVFTDLSQHPGDSRESIYRLRRVLGSYSCFIDIDSTTDLQSVFTNTILPQIKAVFRANFDPKVFCIEDRSVNYDETAKKLTARVQYLYQSSGGEALVEVSQSVEVRETRTIDYTPTHESGEFAADADLGWGTMERVWTRVAIVVGDESPKTRISSKPKAGDAGSFTDVIGGEAGPDSQDGSKVRAEGWNIIANTSHVDDRWIGDPSDEQIKVSVLTETVVERWHAKPGKRTHNPLAGTRGG